MHGQLPPPQLGIASCEARPALEIEIAKPIAGRQSQCHRQQDKRCQRPYLARIKECVTCSHLIVTPVDRQIAIDCRVLLYFAVFEGRADVTQSTNTGASADERNII